MIFLIFAGFCVFGKNFITLWVGDAFNASYYVFIFLVFVNVISLTMSVAMDVVVAENKIRYTATRVLISSLIGVVLSVIVAPKFGALGCAAATGTALVLTQVLYVRYYKKKMGLDMGLFFRNCHLKILPLLTIYSVVAYFLQRTMTINGWLDLLLCMGVYTVGYCLMIWLFIANKYEKDLLLSFVKRNKNTVN